MTTRTKTFFAAAALTAGLLSATVTAQDLDGKVVRNPDDTVTYTIDIDGPPRGSYMLFGSLYLAPRPLPLPGIGNLYLDPYSMFQISPLSQFDSQGKARFSFKLPGSLTDSRCICFQSIVSDRGVLRLTPWISTYQFKMSVPGGNKFETSNVTLAVRHRAKSQTIDGIVKGQEKKTVEIFIYRGGHQIDSFRCLVDKNGVAQINFKYQKPLQYKDIIDIRYDGKSVRRWKHIPSK